MTDFVYLGNLADDELRKLIDNDEHRYEPESDGEHSEYIHFYWDCEVCEAEKVLGRRDAIASSKLPGANPNIYIPGKQTSTYTNIEVSELKVGMVAAYIAKPGSGKYPTDYVECVEVEILDEAVKATWSTTNVPVTTDSSFTVRYELDEDIDVCYTITLESR